MIESMPLLDLLSLMFFPWAIILSFFILYICIIFYNKCIQPPTELALETLQNSLPSLLLCLCLSLCLSKTLKPDI
ncbi:unnamed protein product [Arabidopsis halleri]